MISVSKFYEIDPDQIEAIAREKGTDEKYPYILKIYTKSGRTYAVSYANDKMREDEIRLITARLDRSEYGIRVTQEEIRRVAADEIDKLRPYLKRIEKILKTAGQTQKGE